MSTGSLLLDALIGLALAPVTISVLCLILWPIGRLDEYLSEREWQASRRAVRARRERERLHAEQTIAEFHRRGARRGSSPPAT